ncbi:MAG: hypothetical protein JO164_03095 [Candidatus Eremiobacteraeota bacterium]|nr:hypothetical protein [Candidatus Eremiobacteraeota bacterium]
MNPIRPVHTSRPARANGAAPLVEYVGDGLAADVRIDTVDRRDGAAWYVIRLAGTYESASGRVVGTTARGAKTELGTVDVAPGAMGTARFAVPLADTRRAFDTVRLELRCGERHLHVAVPPPPPARRRGSFRTGVALLATGLAATTLGGATYAASAMRPPPALRTLAAPHAPAVGHAPAAAPTARIVAFSAHRDLIAGGESVLVSYLAVATTGTATVTDPQGNVVARAGFTRQGTTRLPIPHGLETRTLTVRLDARRAASHAYATLDLQPIAVPASVVPATVNATVNAASAATSTMRTTPGAQAAMTNTVSPAGTGTEPFSVVGVPVAGRPLTIAICGQVARMYLRLEDGTGLALDEVNVPPTATTIALRTPPTAAPRIYYLTCTYDTGGGEEVLVRAVSVAASPT